MFQVGYKDAELLGLELVKPLFSPLAAEQSASVNINTCIFLVGSAETEAKKHRLGEHAGHGQEGKNGRVLVVAPCCFPAAAPSHWSHLSGSLWSFFLWNLSRELQLLFFLLQSSKSFSILEVFSKSGCCRWADSWVL